MTWCQPKSSQCHASEIDEDVASERGVSEDREVGNESSNEKQELSFFSSPLLLKPMWTMAKWRHPRTRDGRLAVFIVLSTGVIDTDDRIKTELITSQQLQLSISWLPALLDAEGIMNALLSFSKDLCDGQGP